MCAAPTYQTTKCFLLDGPLMGLSVRRAAVLDLMVAELIEADMLFDEAEARRFLHGCGFHSLDVEVLGPEAWMVAYQHRVVAREMSAS